MGLIDERKQTYIHNGVETDVKTGMAVNTTGMTPTKEQLDARMAAANAVPSPYSPYGSPATTTQPAVVSARQANEHVVTSLADYQNLQRATNARAATTTPAKAATPTPKQEEQPVTLAFMSPDGEVRRQTYYNPSLNKANIQGLILQGWEPIEGTIPDGVGPMRSVADVQRDTEYEGLVKELDTLRTNASAASQRYIDSIRGVYESRRRQIEDINVREGASLKQFGTASGAIRRTASFDSILSEQERQGINRLKDLDVEEQQLIAQAEQAHNAKDYEMLTKKMELYYNNQEAKAKQMEALQQAALARNKEVSLAAEQARKQHMQATRDTSVSSLVAQGITSPTELLDFLNYDDAGNFIGDFTLEEINSALERLTPKTAKLPSGEYGTFLELKNGGEIPATMGYFDYLKKKGDVSRAPRTSSTTTSGGGGSSAPAGGSGNAERDADSIMNGTGLRLDDLSTKDNYRASVAAVLAKRKEAAKASGDMVGLIRSTAGSKATSAVFDQSFEKAVNVVYQISDLQQTIDGEATGPITGIIRSNNPYDKKAQLIKAQLQAIVPNLARGIYGEVGVLTDNDIKNYARTLPNLSNPEDIRNAILGMTLRSVQRSLETKIRVNSNHDLSHLEDVYIEVRDTAEKYLAPLEAQNLKQELDTVQLPGTTPSTSSGGSNAAFWGTNNKVNNWNAITIK